MLSVVSFLREDTIKCKLEAVALMISLFDSLHSVVISLMWLHTVKSYRKLQTDAAGNVADLIMIMMHSNVDI